MPLPRYLEAAGQSIAMETGTPGGSRLIARSKERKSLSAQRTNDPVDLALSICGIARGIHDKRFFRARRFIATLPGPLPSRPLDRRPAAAIEPPLPLLFDTFNEHE